MKGSEQLKKPRARKLQAPSNASSRKTKVSRAYVTHSDSTSISPATTNLRQMLEKLKPHDHLCLIYESPQEWQMAIIPFTKIGLEHGEKCCYFADAHTAEQLRGYLQAEGVDVASAEASGQLVILCESEAYTKEGSFDPDLMISLLITETEKAIADGYPALRLTGEMTWVLHGLPGSERLIEYEAKLNRDFYSKYPALGICQYDRWKFDPEIIKGVIMTHPLLVRGNNIYRNFYYIPTEEFLNQKRAELEAQHWLNNIKREQRVQQSLRESEEKYRSLVENSNVAIASIDLEGKIIFANEALFKLTGYAENEILGKPFSNFIHPDDLQPVAELFLAAPTDLREAIELEFRAVDKQGHDIDMYASMTQMKKDSEIIGFNAIMADITERKKVEERLLFTRFLVDSAADTLACIDQEARFVDVNNAFCRAVGYSREELLSMTVHDIDPDYSAEVWPEFWKKLKQSGSLTFESSHSSKEGRIIPVEIVANYFEYDGKEYHCAFARDVTERKQVEEELKLRAQLLDNATDFIFLRDFDENFVYVNETALKALGYSQEEFLKLKVHQTIAPGYPYTKASLLKELMAKGTVTFETADLCKDGSIIPVESHTRLIEMGGKKFVLSTVRDITERKRLEWSLQKNERRLKEAEKLGKLGNWEFDPATQKIEWSDEVYRLYQRDKTLGPPTPEEEALYYPPEEARRLREFSRLAMENGKAQKYDMAANLPSGRTAFFHCTMQPIKDDQGQVTKLFGTVQDITERKQIETTLRQSEQKYQEVIEGTGAGIVSVDIAGKLIFVNKSICDMLGYPKKHLIGKPFVDFVNLDDQESVKQLFFNAFVNPKGKIDMESRVINRDGEVVNIQAHVSHIKADDKTIGFNAVITDITERKQAEEQYKTIVQTSMDGFWISDLQNRLLDVNNAYCNLIGYSREELLNMSIPDVEAKEPKEEIAQRTQRVTKTGGDCFETQHRCKDGRIIDVEISINYINIAGGRIFVFIRDITERKQAESELLKSQQELRNFSARLQHLREQERTNLAREIHDELGQALTALKMDLSWLSSRLPEENEALQNKAASMSQVIGATTETVRRMSTELRPGLLDDLGLIAAMEWQATEFSKRTGIKCKLVFKPEEIAVERDTATAFFRIFQEVLTNVARHSQATKVTASFKEKVDMLELMVSDNGRGIANEEISSSKSLGLTGIRERVYHFKGKVEIKGKPGKGTTVKVRMARSQPDDKNINS